MYCCGVLEVQTACIIISLKNAVVSDERGREGERWRNREKRKRD